MNGYQITFFTEHSRRHGHTPMHEWLMQLAKSLGIRGSTAVLGAEGFGRRGHFHSAFFFELADQPVEVTLATTTEQVDVLFERLEREQVDLFYVKTPVEFGTVGAPSGRKA